MAMPILPILRDSWYFYRSNLLSIVLLCGPLLLLEGLAELLLQDQLGQEPSAGMILALGLVFAPLYKAVLVALMVRRSRGEPAAAGELYAFAFRLWPSYALLTGLILVITLLGLSLLLLPGLWIAIRLCFADYLLLARGLPPLEALRESFRLTTGHFWSLLGCVALVVFPLLLLGGVVSHPDLGLLTDSAADVPVKAVLGLIQLFMVVVLFRYYMLVEAGASPR